mmetsp:Transcript_8304/g.20398  ORF Transcript_8304/g.20398 Transcript_8304/m.20398 type:complete len:174 (-) Transcript_8304:135-656(-)
MKNFTTTTFSLGAIAATVGIAAATNRACITSDECDSMRKELGIPVFYKSIQASPTKGCFEKNNKAFFVEGTMDEMSDPNVAKIQTRIWCDGNASYDKREDRGAAYENNGITNDSQDFGLFDSLGDGSDDVDDDVEVVASKLAVNSGERMNAALFNIGAASALLFFQHLISFMY